MTYPISDVTRRVVYSGSLGTGPYPFTFEILTTSDIGVYKNTTLLTLSADYSVTINADGTGSVTLTSAATSTDTISIFGNKGIQRQTDFTTGGDLFANSLNDELDAQTIFAQQNSEAILRSIRAPVTDPTTIDMVLPAKADRADTVLTFDTDGNPSATSSSAFVAGLSGAIVGANYVTNNATGDGSTTAFTVSVAAGSKTNIQIYIDGVYQNKASFSVSGTTVTFTEAPPLNSSIEFMIGYAIGSITDASGITYTHSGTSAVTRTVEDKLYEFVSVKDFGADPTGASYSDTAFSNALAYVSSQTNGKLYVPAGKYKFQYPIDYSFPNPASGSQIRTAMSSLIIEGDGADATTLYFPDSNGLELEFNSQQHSVKIRDLSITTDSTGTRTAITLTNTYAFFGTFVAQSALENVTIRPDEGYGAANYWAKCVQVANVSDINFYGLNCYGDLNGLLGKGVVFDQPGAGCFASGSSNTCGTVYMFNSCNFSFLGVGVEVAAHTQTVQLNNCFFAQCETGVYVPYVASNTLQGLYIIGCTSFCFGPILTSSSDLPNLVVSNTMITCGSGYYGLYLDNVNNFTVSGCQFIPYGTANDTNGGLYINSNVSGSIGNVSGNTFSSVNNALTLGASTSDIKVASSNNFTGNNNDVVDSGANINFIRYDDNGLKSIQSNRPIGYGAGAGDSVTQGSGSGKSTGVTINSVCGQITTDNAALASSTEVAFVVTNSSINSEDLIYATVGSGNYGVRITDTASGSFTVRLKNLSGGSLSEAVVIKYAVISAANA